MKSYINDKENKCYILLDKKKKIDDYTEVIDLSELKKGLNSLKVLGKEIINIKIANRIYFNVDTPYYHKFDENYINKLYKTMSYNADNQNIIYKNNRLYVIFEGKEIICPLSIHDLYLEVGEQILTIKVEYK